MTVDTMTRIRLIIDTDDIVRRAVQLRKAKSRGGESMSDIVGAILREALAEEIGELEAHDRALDMPEKKPGRKPERKPKRQEGGGE